MAPKAVKTTARDLELLVLAWQSFKSEPQVDYEVFAQKAGYKNSASACAQFCALKKKLFAMAAATGDSDGNGTATAGSTSAPATPKTASPRKRGAAKSAAAGGDVEGTPSKKARVKKDVAKKEEDEKDVKIAKNEGGDGDQGEEDREV